jgi:hypothetical protein
LFDSEGALRILDRHETMDLRPLPRLLPDPPGWEPPERGDSRIIMRRKPAVVPKITQPKKTPGDTKYRSPFQYECSKGHVIESPSAVTTCPAFHKGSPCKGTLKRVGQGSGRGSHLKKASES